MSLLIRKISETEQGVIAMIARWMHGWWGKDNGNGFRVALACLDYRFIGE